MSKENFKKECKEWLRNYGYFIYAESPSGQYLHFLKTDNMDSGWPLIVCQYRKDLNHRVDILGDIKEDRLNFKTRTGKIQFKHPKIQEYIERFKDYASQGLR